jgi:uncharacterized protein YecE (DUF72 family)
MSKILVGTASWSDLGFIAEWFPPALPASQRLPWYAQHFDMVEVNSSFYSIPDRRTTQHWCEQTPEHFTFNVKLHRLLSRHSTGPDFLPPDLRYDAQLDSHGRVLVTPEMEQAVVTRMLESFEPFERAGKLGVLLLQLPPSFGPRRHQLHELDHLLALLKDYKVAVELRNRDWVEGIQLEATVDFFHRHNLVFVIVDTPAVQHFRLMPAIDITTHPHIGYLRAHGRNARGYLTGRSVAERFDYDYPQDELEEIAERAIRLSHSLDEMHLVFNNNRGAYAPKAALKMKEILESKLALAF